MTSEIIDILLKQSPVIVLMGITLYIMYNYINQKNKVIKEKDDLIIEMHGKLMVLYGQAVTSQNSLTNVIEELRKDFERSNRE